MAKRALLLAATALAAVLWASDAFIAAATSPAVTARLRDSLREEALPVSFRRAWVHPVFLRLDLQDVEVFDPADPGVRVVYAAHASARPDVGSWLSGRRDLASLSLDGASLRIVKDWRGAFNVERIARPEAAGGGWKHQDWFYNLYERLKRAARGGVDADSKGAVFAIGRVGVKGRALLTDRRMKPVVLRDFEARLYGFRRTRAGTAEFDTLDARGTFSGARTGRFDVSVTRHAGDLHASVRLKGLDLAPLLPLYRSTSPVFFDKGYATLVSETRLEPDRIESKNHLRLEDFAMRPAVSWSVESGTVLRALNRHRSLDVRFAITGNPDRPRFEGFEDSLLKALEKDFDPATLALIRARARQEVESAERGLSR